jgi:hypothetical protein
VDASKYQLGKEIFTGKLQPATTQKSALEALQEKLPPEQQKNVRLPEMAGRLSAYEMDALGYYVAVRFRLASVNKDKYDLGSKAFSGKGLPAEASEATIAEQEGALEKIDAKLPPEVKEKAGLARLAGRLTPAELDALAYFAAVRYRLPGIDPRRYGTGKRLFEGKAEPGAVPGTSTTAEGKKLAELEAKLPAEARERAQLSRLAGQLTPEQMAALEYYIFVRYKVR